MAFPWRVEFKLNRYSCDYLAYENLNGNFDAIFNNYVTFMAKRWAKYGKDVAVIPNLWDLGYADYFQRIVRLSPCSLPNPSKILKKSPPAPMVNKAKETDLVDRSWLPFFTLKNWI
jgi:hypothetical protein